MLKGQTLWGISKANGITVEELVYANSDILKGILQIGQTLKIPDGSADQSVNSDTYVVQRGDTKFGLSKKYGVTIDELEDLNPQIVRMLMANQTIKIPKDPDLVESKAENPETDTTNQVTDIEVDTVPEENTEPEKTSEPTITDVAIDTTAVNDPSLPAVVETDSMAFMAPKVAIDTTMVTKTSYSSLASTYIEYEIKAKETLYGLSKKAGMSISDFVKLNPQLQNGAKTGMIIQVPSSSATDPLVSPNSESTTNPTDQRYTDLSKSIKTTKKNQLLLVLPFSEAKFNLEFDRNISYNEIDDEFIKSHLDFYRGSKIAQDSARALGLDFNIDILETQNNPRNTKAAMLAKEVNIDGYNAIIMPFYENDVASMAELVKEQNIPIVTTSSIIEKPEIKNIYNAVPSLNSRRDAILNYISEQNGNLIVVCDVARKESRTYIENRAPNANIIEVNKRGTYNTDDLISQLDSKKVNYVVLESEKNSVFLSTTNALLGQLSKYNIHLTLLDKSLLPSADNVSNKRFIILQMIYPSLSGIKETSLSLNFRESYKGAYGMEPSQYVKYGFDLTYDTLLRLSQEKSFEDSAINEVTEYTALKLDYTSNENGLNDNNGMYIIQYNSDGSLKELK